MLDPVGNYARAVARGQIPASTIQRAACQRHLHDLKRAKSKAFPYRFDKAAAMRAIKFFDFLPHTKGEWEGAPLTLEPWQQFIVGSLFGWKCKKSGFRRFRWVYVEVPRKQGKSTLAAGIGILLAFFDGEPGAEVYSAATKRDQAKIVWGDAHRMATHRAAPHLRKYISASKLSLFCEATNSKFQPLGADADTSDGLNVHGVIIDELHAHKSRDLFDVLETATGARRQPVIFMITTAGTYDPNSVCYEQHTYTRRVLADHDDAAELGGISDERWFGFIATVDKEDRDDPQAWASEEVWRKAQPNYGISSKPEEMASLAAKASELPGALNTFLRLRLDIWTEQVDRWLLPSVWAEGSEAFDLAMLNGRECWAGLDLASTTDITALVLLFPVDGRWYLITRFWVPEDSILERARKDRVPYPIWRDQGHLTATPGNVIDYEHIREEVNRLGSLYDILEIAYDPWNASQIVVQLQDDGAHMVPFRQGYYSMAPAVRELEKVIVGRTMRHGGNPVLDWMAGNVTVTEDAAGNRKIDKGKSSERVDGMVALAMAMGRANLAQGQAYAYDDRELAVV